MFLLGTLLLLLAFVSPSSSDTITGPSHFVLSSDLPALGNRTYSFSTPMLLYVSHHESNQKYDTNIRFIDEKSGVRINAWAAGQSSSVGGTKKAVFLEGRTSITIHNFNEHVFDDTALPALFYFVDASLDTWIYEATGAIERRRLSAGDNSSLTVMSASMSISLFDFKFPKDSSVRVTAGGIAQVENEQHEIITFDDHISDVSSWANLPLPLVTLTSNEMESFQMSVTTKQADRSMAPVGVKTVVMSPGYGFDDITTTDKKYSFKLEKSATVQVDYVGTLHLSSSSLEVIGSSGKGKQTYEQKFDSKNWVNRTMNATFSAETISVDIRHSIGSREGVLIRIYTSDSSLLSCSSLLLLSLLRLF